jgi:hypothetical protein
MKQDQEWNAPSQEQEQIIALQAKVKRLKVSKANKSNHNKESETETTTSTGTSKSNKGKKGRRKRKPKWMLIPPKQGESHKKKMNGKTYNWCPKHKVWGIHLPSECEGKRIYPRQMQGDSQRGRISDFYASKEESKDCRGSFKHSHG